MDSQNPMNNQNSDPNTPPAPQPQPSSSASSAQKSSMGPLFGVIIVIALLAVGGFYFWLQSAQNETPELPYIPGDGASEDWQPATTNSDEAADIEADLEATNIGEFETLTEDDLEATDSSL